MYGSHVAFPAAFPVAPDQHSFLKARMTASGPVCENGRPYITDPTTGRTVCMCQIREELYPTTLTSSEGLRALGHTPGPGEPSAFRSPLTCATGLGPDREAWKALAPTLASHYDPALALHPYSTFYAGLDLNSAARRKAATRETTSPLKAWLNEHRKNPYPTKAEKIMLAIITKMTMTQVSTWFANARRRLKKENKMCWDSSDRDDEDDDKDDDKDSQADKSDEISVGKSMKTDDDDSEIQLSDISDVEDNLSIRLQPGPRMMAGSAQFPTEYSLPHPPVLRDNQSSNICAQNRTNPTAKPKIWSISHILEPKDDSSTQSETNSAHIAHDLSSSRANLTSSRLTNHELSTSSHVSSELSNSSHSAFSIESPRYRLCSSSLETTPSPQKSTSGSQHPRPPLDTPPDTPPFDNYHHSTPHSKEQKTQEYEALNLKTDRPQESPRT